MKLRPGGSKQYRVLRALSSSDGAPVLAEDLEDGGRRVVLRPIHERAAPSALLFKGVRHVGLGELTRIERSVEHGLIAVAPWVEGEDLAVAAARHAPVDRLRVVLDVGRALRHLHEIDLIHGDIKPENVIVTPDGRGVLIDPAGPQGGVRGTLSTMAPERLLKGPATKAADLYSFGGLLCFAITGRPPHEGADALTLVRAVMAGPPNLEAPPGVDDDGVIVRLTRGLLAREPSLRPTTARVVVSALAAALGQQGDLPRPRTTMDALAQTPPAPREDVRRVADRFLDRVARARDRVPYLVLAGGPGSGRTSALDAVQERALVSGALCVRASAKDDAPPDEHPAPGHASLVVLLDDMHEATAEWRSWLRSRAPVLSRLAPTTRLGIVGAGEHDESLLALPRGAMADGDDGVVVHRLAPLDPRDVEDRLHRALPSLVSPEVLAEKIIERSDGHPATSTALLARFAGEGGFRSSGDALVADLGRLTRLGSVSPGAVARRIESMAAPERAVVALLSRTGVPVSATDLAAALGVPPYAVLESIRGLMDGGVVRSTGPGQPRYALALGDERDAARAATEVASDVAIRLARRSASRERDVGAGAVAFEAVARLLGAARRPAASRFFLRAARARFDAGESSAALANLERAAVVRGRVTASKFYRLLHARALAMEGDVEPADRALANEIERFAGDEARALVLDRVHLLERAGRADEALAVFDAAVQRTELGDTRALAAARAWSQFASGDVEGAHHAIDALLERVAPSERNVSALETYAVAAALLDRRADRRGARAAAVLARRIARALDRPARAAHFDSTLGVFDVDAGYRSRGLRRIRRAVAILERVDDRRLLPDTLVRLGYQLLAHGDATDALDAFVRARLLFARTENRRGIGWARTGEGRARLELGDPRAAAECFAEAVEDRVAARSLPGAALAAVHLYIARRTRGDADRAREAAVMALRLSRGDEGRGVRVELELALAETAAEERDVRRLLGHARRAMVRIVDGVRGDLAARAGALLAAGHLARGDVRRALTEARRARFAARATGRGAELARATAVRAAAHLARERPYVARMAFARAVRFARDAESAVVVRLIWARAVLRAVTEGDDGEAGSALTALADAEATAALRGDRLRQGAARAIVSALEVAKVGAATGAAGEPARRGRALRQVLEATRWINEARSSKDVLDRIIDAALPLTRASRGFVVVRSDDDEHMRFAAARQLRREDILDPEMQLSRSIVEEAMASGETVVTSEARTDERFRATASISSLELLSVMCAPLRTGERTLGAIYVDDPTRVDRFDEVSVEHLETLASQAALALEKAQLLAQVERLNRGLTRDLARAKRDLAERGARRSLVTEDAEMLRILELVERVADSDAPVLIMGGPGTGKEMLARGLHDSSHRRRRPFVPVNCAALPESLVESELFGYVKGAFTGALRDRDGLVAAADGGTLFLDEVGEMPPSVQAKLLRVLQDGEFVPLGSTEPRVAQIRLVSATHQPLERLIGAGTFREDFYYRIKVIQLDVPALKDRRGDVALLVRHFADRIALDAGDQPRKFSDEAVRQLSRGAWKGNVRELEAVVRSLVLTVDHDPIGVDDLPEELRGVRGTPRLDGPIPRLKEAVDTRERELVAEALRREDGHRQRAADVLGISRRWLQKLIDKHGL